MAKTAKTAKTAKIPSAAIAAVGWSAGSVWPGGRRSGSSAGSSSPPRGPRPRSSGGGRPREGAGALTAAYVAAFAGSHPLAKKVGAWPSVFGVAGAVALASWAVADRHAQGLS